MDTASRLSVTLAVVPVDAWLVAVTVMVWDDEIEEGAV